MPEQQKEGFVDKNGNETKDFGESKENSPHGWEYVSPPTKQENRDFFITAELKSISRTLSTLKLGIYVLIILLLIILWKVW